MERKIKLSLYIKSIPSSICDSVVSVGGFSKISSYAYLQCMIMNCLQSIIQLLLHFCPLKGKETFVKYVSEV